MSGPDDPSDPTTSPGIESVAELPIRAGDAQHTVLAAISNLVAAVINVEKVAMAAARALDENEPIMIAAKT
jgi:hypothetical protein